MQDNENSAALGAGAAWVAAMRRGDFVAAWHLADAVLAGRRAGTRDDPSLPYHLRWVWDGRPVEGRDVLVRCYHGLGDTLNFCRYLPELRRRAGRVTLEAQPALLPLLRLVPGVDRLVAFDPAQPLPPAELDVEIMELAHVLRVRPQDAPSPDIAERLGVGPSPRSRNSRDGPVPQLALCWESGEWDRSRSVPLPALRAALAPHAPFVSLQRGQAAVEAVAPWFVNAGDDDGDVTRTARLITASRLVVTVDTMVAHLAGVLGAPTILLLKHEPDWRWGAGEGVSQWYPSVTMLRQRAPGDWSAPTSVLPGLVGRRVLTR